MSHSTTLPPRTQLRIQWLTVTTAMVAALAGWGAHAVTLLSEDRAHLHAETLWREQEVARTDAELRRQGYEVLERSAALASEYRWRAAELHALHLDKVMNAAAYAAAVERSDPHVTHYAEVADESARDARRAFDEWVTVTAKVAGLGVDIVHYYSPEVQNAYVKFRTDAERDLHAAFDADTFISDFKQNVAKANSITAAKAEMRLRLAELLPDRFPHQQAIDWLGKMTLEAEQKYSPASAENNSRVPHVP